MPLDPQAKAMLDTFAAMGMPPLHTLSVAEARLWMDSKITAPVGESWKRSRQARWNSWKRRQGRAGTSGPTGTDKPCRDTAGHCAKASQQACRRAWSGTRFRWGSERHADPERSRMFFYRED